jgi:FkbM family methyltransferase
MTVRSAVVNLLDRPGGRGILTALTNSYARSTVGSEVGVSFDQVWAHRVGDLIYPDSSTFNYFAADVKWWSRQPQHDRELALDYWFHVYQPKPGDTIVDVGAGKGEDIPTFVDAVAAAGRVIAVEAHPDTFAILEHLCRLNRLRNTTCVNVAAVDRSQTVHISSDSDWQSNAIRSSAPSTIAVPGETIDELCKKHSVGRIDFLKMNIEGAEKAALRGMTQVIQRVQCICVACHDFRADRGESSEFRTRQVVIDYLRAHGFEITTRDTDARDWVRDHVHARRARE